jgi:DNA-binding response OmpR family regulator
MQAFVVATDQEEREILTFVLRHAGLAVSPGTDLPRVLSNWQELPADLIVVAADDPQALLDGVRAVREVTEVPLVLLAERLTEERLCGLLRAGADLVLERPISPRVFAEYARGILRRTGAVPAFMLPRLDLDEIALDPATRTVAVPGREPRRLTQLEFRLLYVLMTNREQVIPTEVIVERVWGYSGEGDKDLVRGLVSRLRHKIEPDPDNPRFIETISGVGYRFSLQPAAPHASAVSLTRPAG